MSLTKKEATILFNSIEKSSKYDNKITRADLEKAVAVDTNGDGKITDDVQKRTLPNGTITEWTEKEIVDNNVNEWIKCANDKWMNDEPVGDGGGEGSHGQESDHISGSIHELPTSKGEAYILQFQTMQHLESKFVLSEDVPFEMGWPEFLAGFFRLRISG